jgi:hypothetical protein
MNGQTVALFCDGVLHEANFGETWTANVTNLGAAIATTTLTTNGFANTRASRGSEASVPPQVYEEVTWLVFQFTPAEQHQWVSIQHAIRDLTYPNAKYTDIGN